MTVFFLIHCFRHGGEISIFHSKCVFRARAFSPPLLSSSVALSQLATAFRFFFCGLFFGGFRIHALRNAEWLTLNIIFFFGIYNILLLFRVHRTFCANRMNFKCMMSALGPNIFKNIRWCAYRVSRFFLLAWKLLQSPSTVSYLSSVGIHFVCTFRMSCPIQCETIRPVQLHTIHHRHRRFHSPVKLFEFWITIYCNQFVLQIGRTICNQSEFQCQPKLSMWFYLRGLCLAKYLTLNPIPMQSATFPGNRNKRRLNSVIPSKSHLKSVGQNINSGEREKKI